MRLAALLALPLLAQAQQFDVIVVSGSSGGVAAALAAGRLGARVALVEDTPVLGGMLANGISNIDTYSYESLSGIFEEFRSRVRAHYQPVAATDPAFANLKPPPRDHRGRQSNSALEGGRWEPHVADMIFKQMVAETPSITVFYNTWATRALMRQNRILGVETENKAGATQTLLAPFVIDATHEADVAALAGAPYRTGREPRSPREPHAGQIRYFNGSGEILPNSSGRQDRALVSSGLRLCIRLYSPSEGDAHILRTPPPNYNPDNYRLAGFSGEISMPGRKTEMNVNPVGNELQFVNWDWPEASRARRAQLYQAHLNHALGFLYFLQHERKWTHLGLPTDEFTDNAHVPYRVFIRESRRIEGETTLDETDVNPWLLARPIPTLRPDSIAIGHYAIDSKPVLPKTDPSTPDKGEGDFFLANVTAPFQIPYGAIVPKNVDGLLVPVALSATHVAFSAIRMDPTWVATGQAAGTAAALALRHKTSLRDLPLKTLQSELLRQKARLFFYWDLPLDHPAFSAIQTLTLQGSLSGFPDRTFQPDAPITRAQFAALAARALRLWPSVSDFHFNDVPRTHWALRDIETLFDHGLLRAFSVEPRWPAAGRYEGPSFAGFARPTEGAFGPFHPDQPVSTEELAAFLRLTGDERTPPPAPLTRAAAALLFAR